MRIIFHSDLNNFYATCETLLRPEYKGLPLVVCGKIEDRHGIILAKSELAKKAGIKTGMPLFEARKLMPNLITVEANHDLYLDYSKKVKEIYKEYTSQVESFGIDEAWLDVTSICKNFSQAEILANEIRERVKTEIGLTVSIGVSFNKVFAKLGSDLKKPDAVTIITKDNYKELVWRLPVEELLFVGRATKTKLNNLGVRTIGGLANYDLKLLKNKFGKVGEKLWAYANGLDISPVQKVSEHEEIKSVGNSSTFYRDMTKLEDIESLFYLLSESVAKRVKNYHLNFAKTIHISVVDKELNRYSYQASLAFPTNCSNFIAESAINLFKLHIDPEVGIRALGVTVSNFVTEEQLSIGEEQLSKDKSLKLDEVIEGLRGRFGKNSINRAMLFSDKRFLEITPSGMAINATQVQ